ncbi:translation initiation factor IF-5A [Sulfolobales archaeon HS-7]|nr:translation initiation factor IF-5A [Sulfolobales archaeon HS-7]
MTYNYAAVGDLKQGSYVIIDGEPCRVVEVTKAKTGKHGSAKANVIAVGLFTGNKKTIMAPVDQRVEVPIIEKHVGQVISDRGELVEIMDLESYETFQIEKPKEEDIASKIRPEAEVEYWNIAGRKKIVRVK